MRQSVYFDVFDKSTVFIIRKNWNNVILNQKAMVYWYHNVLKKLEILETLSKKLLNSSTIFNGKKICYKDASLLFLFCLYLHAFC